MTIVAIDASARGSVRFGILETEKNGLSRDAIATERRVRVPRSSRGAFDQYRVKIAQILLRASVASRLHRL